MTTAQLRNLGMYALYVLVGAVIAAGMKLGAELGGDGEINWRAIAEVFVVTFFSAAATAYGASRQPRVGSEELAADVRALQDKGVPRSEMVVVSQEEAARALAVPAPSTPALTYHVVMHRECGRAAFETIEQPVAGQNLDASEVRHLDHSPVIVNDPVTCDSCGAHLSGVLVERGQWVAVSAAQMLGGG